MMTRLHHQFSIFCFLLLTLLIAACSGTQDSINEGLKSYTTKVVDSVMFDRLSALRLLDYNANTKEFLIADWQTREVLVVNENGELITIFNPHVEGPNYVGNNDFGWSFYGDDGLICHGDYYFYRFDKKGNRISRVPYPVETQGLWSLDGDPLAIDSYTNQGETEVLVFITEPAGHPYNSQAFQDSTFMMYRMNFETGESYPVMEKQPESVYRTLGKFVDRGWPYVAKVKNDRFAQVYSIDSLLYIFDVVENRLVNAISLPKDFQPQYETIEFGEKGQPDRYRINSSILSTGDYIVVSAMGTIPESIISEISKKVDLLFESPEYKEAVKKYMTTTDLLFDENRYLGQVKSGIGKTEFWQIGSDDGHFWVQRRYDDERDYKTFLKVKIVEDTNPREL
jgi:hypothetical protein